jgi:hypothetical protein
LMDFAAGLAFFAAVGFPQHRRAVPPVTVTPPPSSTNTDSPHTLHT